MFLYFKYNILHIFIFLITCFTINTQAVSADRPVTYDDPWEEMNRSIFFFNDKVDAYALKPLAEGYNAITPQPIQRLVSNFFRNLGDIRNTLNSALQLKGFEVIKSSSRLVINSTIGMLGFLDVATPIGIERSYEDFGLTLARWGMPSGPYIVAPIFGPKTLRSGLGFVPDLYSSPIYTVKPDSAAWALAGAESVNLRSELLKAEDLILGDRYTFVRNAYLQWREYLITGENLEDDF